MHFSSVPSLCTTNLQQAPAQQQQSMVRQSHRSCVLGSREQRRAKPVHTLLELSAFGHQHLLLAHKVA